MRIALHGTLKIVHGNQEQFMPLFCSRCGSENDVEATTCVKCDSAIGHVDPQSVVNDDKPAGNKLTWAITAVVCAVYLLYPSLGVFELIPDAFPMIGSLDEAAATTALLIALSRLGFNPFANRSKPAE